MMTQIESQDSDHDLLRSSGTSVGYDRGNVESVVARLAGDDESGRATDDFDPSKSYGETRAAFESDFEQRYVSWLLVRHSGNISAAAREARMDRKHLHDLAKKHGLRGQGTAGRK